MVTLVTHASLFAHARGVASAYHVLLHSSFSSHQRGAYFQTCEYLIHIRIEAACTWLTFVGTNTEGNFKPHPGPIYPYPYLKTLNLVFIGVCPRKCDRNPRANPLRRSVDHAVHDSRTNDNRCLRSHVLILTMDDTALPLDRIPALDATGGLEACVIFLQRTASAVKRAAATRLCSFHSLWSPRVLDYFFYLSQYRSNVILVWPCIAPFLVGTRVSGSERPTTGVACENGIHSGWTDLCVSPDELRPSATLIIGQCFNWQQAAPDCWVGVLGCEVVAVRCSDGLS